MSKSTTEKKVGNLWQIRKAKEKWILYYRKMPHKLIIGTQRKNGQKICVIYNDLKWQTYTEFKLVNN